MTNTLPIATVTVAQLRAAIASEQEALKEVLEIVRQERANLGSEDDEAPTFAGHACGTFHKERALNVVTTIGGDELQAARRGMTEAADRLYRVAAEVDKHNEDLSRLSFWGGLIKRRSMMRRANELDEQRREAMAAYESEKEKAENLLKSLATPDNIVAAFKVSREMRSRFREAANKKKHLRIKRRLLNDNLELCVEIDAMLAMLDDDIRIEVSESDLQTLMRDVNFRGSLNDLVAS